jgi:hypothetical protein
MECGRSGSAAISEPPPRITAGSAVEPAASSSTSGKLEGHWRYLYRATDRSVPLIDVIFNEHRDMAAVKAFHSIHIFLGEAHPVPLGGPQQSQGIRPAGITSHDWSIPISPPFKTLLVLEAVEK